ncbi:MAG: Lrp/AsnC family transcriptional regulator [Gammaproteobacteria bacterium]|nr:MAG: Lrp/AsnC family transcriptional regulator [Gammaproteobacteria bacterium]
MNQFQKKIIKETQSGLPLVKNPYDEVAYKLDIDELSVITEFQKMLQNQQIRRIGAVPNHYKLGIMANGMSVWNIDDNFADEFGKELAKNNDISHCYLRPRHKDIWQYNIFAMIHATCKDKVWQKVYQIALEFGIDKNKYDILFSKRILKKTGMRF